MTRLPVVLHMVDDTTAGGVMRVLDFLCSDPELAKTAQHKMQVVQRGKWAHALTAADVVVSHLAVSWRNLPALVVLRARCALRPLIHVEHSYTENFVSHNVRRTGRFFRLLKIAYGCFDYVVSVSNAQASWMVDTQLLHGEKLFTIQSCVSLEAYRTVHPPNFKPRVFGAIGRLDAQKGFDTLIRAFRSTSAPDIELHIIGEGAQEGALRRLAQNDPRVVFKGFHDSTSTALANIDVVVMPSRWEAYGLVAIEALAAGRRLICSNIDGLRDHAQHGAVLFDTEEGAGLDAVIMQEVQRARGVGKNVPKIGTAQFEDKFRQSWNRLLSKVCATPA